MLWLLRSDFILLHLQVCGAAVGVAGDLCRALGKEIIKFSDDLMMMLLENLSVSLSVSMACNCACRYR